ncbi:MAG: hypothetical protein JWR46_1586 [Mycobacterium sp.]|nr:hypothetical protein [Mycobacterium sp.]MCW2552663.1 hypothetical protein [Mycobacterium sp.]MCW2731807.1 hypothetical protein [Mycobacterium sp.]
MVLASALRDVLSNPQQPRTQAFLASIRCDSGIRFVLYLPFFTGDGRDTWLDIVFHSAACALISAVTPMRAANEQRIHAFPSRCPRAFRSPMPTTPAAPACQRLGHELGVIQIHQPAVTGSLAPGSGNGAKS